MDKVIWICYNSNKHYIYIGQDRYFIVCFDEKNSHYLPRGGMDDFMDFRSMHYALAVKEAGSISLAAKILYTSQPNVSNVLKRLEEELGFPIFLRTSGGVIVSENGQHFLSDVESVVTRFLELESTYTDSSSVLQDFAISAIDSDIFSQACLSAQQDPALSSDTLKEGGFFEGTMESVFRDVKTRVSGMGLIYFPEAIAWNIEQLLTYEGLIYQRICQDGIYILTHKDNPLPLSCEDDFSGLEDCVLVDYDKMYHKQLSFSTTQSSPWLMKQTFRKLLHVSERASKYTAISMLPSAISFSCRLTSATLERYQLKQIICPPLQSMEFGYVHNKDFQHTAMSRVVIDLVKELLKF